MAHTFRARLLGRMGAETPRVTVWGRGRMTVEGRTMRWRPAALDRIVGRRSRNGPIAIEELQHVVLGEHPRFKRHVMLVPNAAPHGDFPVFVSKRQPVLAWFEADRWTIQYLPQDELAEREAIAVPPGRRVVTPSDGDEGPLSEPDDGPAGFGVSRSR